MKLTVLLCVFFIGFTSAATAEATAPNPPAIFFTDLSSGPNSGGLDGNGAILTIYGVRFGRFQNQATVTIGGGLVAKYLLWSDTKIAVEIGPAAATGNVMVRTLPGPGWVTSNGVPFTVRSGNIYCVSNSGGDASPGTFPSSCWATLVKAKDTMAPGDITYALDGVNQTVLDGGKAALFIKTSGAPSMPIALVAFPGAKVTIGSVIWGDANGNLVRDGIRIGSGSFNPSHWVVAGMFIQAIQAINFAGVSDDWRLVGNDMTCPNGSAEMPVPYTASFGYEGFGCATGGGGGLTNLVFYGNNVHDTGTNCSAGLTSNGGNGEDACKLYHGVYFGPGNFLDIGWNVVAPNGGGCRAIQFHNSSGHNQFGLSVHDNVIHDSVCDGINFATVDPSQGIVQAYNNVIYNAGTGPDPGGMFSNYSCIYSADKTNHGNPGSGVIEVFNNTLFNCGARPDSSSGAITKDGNNPALTISLRNNIINQGLASDGTLEDYVAQDVANISGTNNLWFGVGASPTGFHNSLNSNPRFIDLGQHNLHLLPSSPAVDSGVDISSLLTDQDGINRAPGDIDVGAYQVVPPGSVR